MIKVPAQQCEKIIRLARRAVKARGQSASAFENAYAELLAELTPEIVLAFAEHPLIFKYIPSRWVDRVARDVVSLARRVWMRSGDTEHRLDRAMSTIRNANRALFAHQPFELWGKPLDEQIRTICREREQLRHQVATLERERDELRGKRAQLDD